ncbi:MliC family protein (plasmid) [Pseudomonas yamanorum]|nr:MliC family protein [Pseudomonas yamanorum]
MIDETSLLLHFLGGYDHSCVSLKRVHKTVVLSYYPENTWVCGQMLGLSTFTVPLLPKPHNQDRTTPQPTEAYMRTITALTFTSTLLFISACAVSPQKRTDVETSASAQSASTVHNYHCESGETVAATYPTTDSSTIKYKGSAHKMQIAISGSGSRYVGDGLEWWTKGSGPGSDGMLFRHQPDGTSGDSIDICTES